ncbi:orotidine-5'-phosphate decarboxylase [Saccharopolyspora shandongensis]|uniref:Orotidine 5'-phosphate decarboxylase n=1 Tax=Saccharopolyspora shandongensis TaxID=418495 RepID=A0A1H3RDZ6_9PSEU|nr:orotidine-5'-phosphate decarboxylase [Saccharopolyspora shandongensis]SDZ23783.1 orotidine-5'-phosphate decarboxylase [Saccharopolyspora shandongensis]
MTDPLRAGFGQRLADSVRARGALCVGIDPHPSLLHAWDLDETPQSLERFAMTAVEALAGEVAVLKPQSAFFEVYGSAGVAVLERTIREAQQAGALVLLDIKRGDIGSTMTAYAMAYLDEHAPLASDAITVSPYLGYGSLAPAIGIAEQTGRGVFVLARTSNPEGAGLQQSIHGSGDSVAQYVVDSAAESNAGAEPMGHVGVVAGATIRPEELDFSRLNGPILAPGLGAQGATVQSLRAVFGAALPNVLPATARDVLRHGPTVDGLRSTARRVRDEVTELLQG